MPGKRISDENNRSDRDPLNERADFKEIDHDFRKRLDNMIPDHLAERIQEIMERRLREYRQNNSDESEAM